jgi:thiol-disulfide isomerase/thioredoxin/sugar lactone lactonase YvrE
MLRSILLVLLGLLCAGCAAESCSGKTHGGAEAGADGGPDRGIALGDGPMATLPPPAERPRATDFSGGGRWLNASRPLTLADLAGHVVVVHFWASSCIACLEALPMIAEVEQRYGRYGVGAVGVHTSKLDTESEPERLRSAMFENGIGHPVVLDAEATVAGRWKAEARPSVFVVDARGAIAWTSAGVPKPGELVSVVRAALSEAIQARVLKQGALPAVSPEQVTTGALAFPGKVRALDKGGFAVSDTGHHRVAVVDASSGLQALAGDAVGEPGFTDGFFPEASFRRPQGLAQIGDVLYVADAGNHAIRALDLAARTVKTVAGTGALGAGALKEKADGKATALRSPWDVVAVNDLLYVALAGTHQIAVVDPKAGTITPFAGSGAEGHKDGAALEAAFDQPVGLATDGKTLWVTDAGNGGIRAIDLATQKVSTVVGQDPPAYGDIDGPAAKVRLEHPQGVLHGAAGKKDPAPALFFCDTFNSKVKRVDPRTGATRTIAGGRGHGDLFEPTGIALLGADLLVADTRHHRVARIVLRGDNDADVLVEPVPIRGLVAPVRRVVVGDKVDAGPPPAIIAARDVPTPARGTRLKLVWHLPTGTVLDEVSLVKINWDRAQFDHMEPMRDLAMQGLVVKNGFPFSVKPHPGAKTAHASGTLELRVCDEKTRKTCIDVKRPVELDLAVSGDDEGAAGPVTEIAVVLPPAQ